MLKNYAGIDVTKYATINPDDIKEEMADMGMIPKVKGLTPMEASPLAHEEASYLSKQLMARLIGTKTNVILDITMSSVESTKKRVEPLKSHGYTSIKAVFVSISPDVSKERAAIRYREGINSHISGTNPIGGRTLPAHVIDEQRTSNNHFKSKNEETLVAVANSGLFTSQPQVFDNNRHGEEPVVLNYSTFSGMKVPPRKRGGFP